MIFLTFFIGLIANFIGYIPPGNINLSLMQLTINRGMKQALQFMTAFSCVEFFFTYFIMHAAKWLSSQMRLDTIIDWVMMVLFAVLGTITWLNRKKPPETKEGSEHDSIRYGILLGFLNPMQIPFWMVTGTYLITHEWILFGKLALVIFSLGSAAGAFLCLFLYAHFARYIQSKFALSNKFVNTAIAILFFSFAGYHVVKRVYLAIHPKHPVSTITLNQTDNNLKYLIGEWEIAADVEITNGKAPQNNTIKSTETEVLCNVCPKIIFAQQHGFIKYPDNQITCFDWSEANGELVLKTKETTRGISSGAYKLTYKNQLKYKKLVLTNNLENVSYILVASYPSK